MATGVILAGGRSRRMGENKALLELGGRRIVDRVFEALAGVVDGIVVVRAADPWIDDIAATRGAPVVTDRYPGAGSLGGIYTGLEAAGDTSLVVACDMPFLNQRLLADLIALAAGADVAVPIVAGKHETLHAVYQPACLAPIRARIAAGKYKIVDFFGQVQVRSLPETEVRERDPDLLSSFNVNTPEDYERARRLMTQERFGT